MSIITPSWSLADANRTDVPTMRVICGSRVILALNW